MDGPFSQTLAPSNAAKIDTINGGLLKVYKEMRRSRIRNKTGMIGHKTTPTSLTDIYLEISSIFQISHTHEMSRESAEI